MKQRRLLTGIALFLAVYMTAALGWWTFSLLKYSVAESNLQMELLEQQRLLCYHKFQAELHAKTGIITEENFSYELKTEDFNNLVIIANNCANNYKMTPQVFQERMDGDSVRVELSYTIPEIAAQQIQNKLRNKQE